MSYELEAEKRSRDAWKNIALHLAGELGEAREQILALEEAVSASKVIEGVLRGQVELSRAMMTITCPKCGFRSKSDLTKWEDAK